MDGFKSKIFQCYLNLNIKYSVVIQSYSISIQYLLPYIPSLVALTLLNLNCVQLPNSLCSSETATAIFEPSVREKVE